MSSISRIALGAFFIAVFASLLPTALLAEEVNDVSTSQTWTLGTSIGDIVADQPQTARIFELIDIDYCCGGKTPLGKAALSQDIKPAQLLNALLVVGAHSQKGPSKNWQTAEIDELLDHIVATHHTWLRRELPRLVATTQTVLRVHGDAHAELKELMSTLDDVQNALLPHLDVEEQQIFPAIRELAAGKPSADAAKKIAEMVHDHDTLGAALHRLRSLTNGYAPPEDACAKYNEMLTGLAEFERDMHTHVHLENNVLVPRVEALLAARDNQ